MFPSPSFTPIFLIQFIILDQKLFRYQHVRDLLDEIQNELSKSEVKAESESQT